MKNPENHIANYYLLRRLVMALNDKFSDCKIDQCYSLNKNEIVFDIEDLQLKVYLAEQSFAWISEKKGNAPAKVKIQYPEVVGKKVIGFKAYPQDRSFRMILDNGLTLVFLMYGRNGNILLFNHQMAVGIFKPEFEKSKEKSLADFNVHTEPNQSEFAGTVASHGFTTALKQHFPALSKGMLAVLANEEPSENVDAAWQLIKDFESELLTGTVRVLEDAERNIFLNLIPLPGSGQVLYSGTDIIAALEQYAQKYFYARHFIRVKNEQVIAMKARLDKCGQQLAASVKHLQYLENDSNYKNIADIIMANLHQIPAGAEQVELYDFYQDKNVAINLKRGISPQAWAEKLYKKAKNQEIEKQHTREKIKLLRDQKDFLAEEYEKLVQIDNVREFKEIAKAEKSENKDVLPFRHIQFEGYDIYIGKNSANNDKLTFGFAHKEDLWMHASGVSGSHVVVKHKTKDKTIPKTVIEKAASAAAYFSKSKGSILVPVIYTTRKFVRKPKGAAPGAVIVEKEKMIMAKPDFRY